MPPGMIAVQVGSQSRSASRQCRRSLVTARNFQPAIITAISEPPLRFAGNIHTRSASKSSTSRFPCVNRTCSQTACRMITGGKLIAGNRDRYAES
jgi:hypothetical protein